MLANGGHLDGVRVVGRKTLELMHGNRIPSSLLPFEILSQPMNGFGFGLGSRVMVDVAQSAGPGSVGEFGWAGAATVRPGDSALFRRVRFLANRGGNPISGLGVPAACNQRTKDTTFVDNVRRS